MLAPVSVSMTINDQRALDGWQWAYDAYVAEQRAADPAFVPPTPNLYLRARLLTWLRKEADRRDPLTSEDPDILRAEVLRLRQP